MLKNRLPATVLFQLWLQLKNSGYGSQIIKHLLRAEDELLAALSLSLESIYNVALPYAKTDPMAALFCEIFKFGRHYLAPFVKSDPISQDPLTKEQEALQLQLKHEKKHFLMTLRNLLLEQRNVVITDPKIEEDRHQLIAQILSHIEKAIQSLELNQDETPVYTTALAMLSSTHQGEE